MSDPKETIEQARACFAEGRFEDALDLYDYFYEHALEEDPNYYGVRLSYCLEEWAALAEKYPPARARLEEKMATALALLDTTREPERFHDYHAICHFLKLPKKPVETFLACHNFDPQLAQSIFKFVRDDLVEAKEWEICAMYLPQPNVQYGQFLQAFDGAMIVNLRREEDEETISFTKAWMVENMANLLLILKNTDQDKEAGILYEQFSLDMMARGYDELTDAVDEKIGA